MADIKLKQQVYIAINSESLSCDEIEAHLGIAADEHNVLGIKRHERDPSWPLINSWRLACDDNIRVDEQIEFLMTRLLPVKKPLIKLVDAQQVDVVLEVVRYFDHSEGEREYIDDAADFIKLPGQHQLLGWSISADNLAFLASIKADLDVDEYN